MIEKLKYLRRWRLFSSHAGVVAYEKQPPDLEAWLSNKFRGVFAKRSGSKDSAGRGEASGDSGSASTPIFLVAGVVCLLWFLSGILVIPPVEEAVVLRFGRYVSTLGPGLHWIPRIVKKAYRVNVQHAYTFSYRADMLTQDENIAYVSLSVQFRVNEPKKFLFHVDEPVRSLEQATASALRQVVGHTALSQLLTVGRATVRDQVAEQINRILDRYDTGLFVIDVNLQLTKPPEEVRPAFDDAIKAREDKQRYVNQAQAYQKRVVPLAEGRAEKILAEAKAARQQFILRARGDVARYLALLPEYRRNKKLVKQYLTLQAVEKMLAHSKKVWIDTNKGQNLFYLPMNQLLANQLDHTVSDRDVNFKDASQITAGSQRIADDALRTRSERSTRLLRMPSGERS